jgi:hypothetical protein
MKRVGVMNQVLSSDEVEAFVYLQLEALGITKFAV